jgi:hypothetical protein
MPNIATVEFESISVYQQGRPYTTPKNEKEAPDAYEQRTWRDRMHVTDDGYVFIPPMQFKKCLDTAAKFLGIKIPGKGNSLYTKHFLAGVLVFEGIKLNVKKEDVPSTKVFCDSRGVRGGSNPRVWKNFPTIQEWSGSIDYYVMDDTIPKDVFEKVVKESGNFVGIGVFRPENGGYYGRFVVNSVNWRPMS